MKQNKPQENNRIQKVDFSKEAMEKAKKEMFSGKPQEEQKGWEELNNFLETLHIHNEGLSTCFHDHLASGHLKSLIHQLLSQQKPEHKIVLTDEHAHNYECDNCDFKTDVLTEQQEHRDDFGHEDWWVRRHQDNV